MKAEKRFVLASANPDKAAEVRAILEEALDGIEIVPRPRDVPDIEETGETLEENARLKAKALVAATGLAAVADDTGLEVAALGGAPGVYSARYAGERASYRDNVERLLAAMQDVPAGKRSARFRTVAIAVFPRGNELIATGEIAGVIGESARGAGGFGYDPVFVPAEGDGRTFAEMSPDEKNALSHRGLAFRALARLLEGA